MSGPGPRANDTVVRLPIPIEAPVRPSPSASRRRATLGVAASALILGSVGLVPARAAITGTTGAVSLIDHPTGTLDSNTLESDTTMYAWFEGRVDDPGSLDMDHVGLGTVNSNASSNAGTVDPGFALSYVVHFDQAGGGNAKLSASITFERSIIGVWSTAAGLSGSDGTFAPTGLTYGNLQARRFELGTGNNDDRYSITNGGRTLTIIQARTSGNGVDQLRVLVNPEPGTGALLGLGIVGLAVMVRRRRRSRPARQP